MDTAQRQNKIYYGWWVLLACIVGLLVGPGQFAFGSLGLFIIPMQEEFGWSRSEISLATTIFTVALIFSMPVVGKYVDRYGSRQVLIPAMLIVGGSLAVLPVVTSRLWHLYLVFLLIGSLGAAANSLPFMLTISSWFDRRRGIAIGMAMAGSGLGYASVPPVIEYVNGQYGWRFGYYTLAAIILLFAIPLIYLLFRNSPVEMGLLPDGDVAGTPKTVNAAPNTTGMTRKQALSGRNFWLLFSVFSILAFCLFGLLLHFVPMLVDRGISAENAAFAASSVGITIMIVRVLIGYLMDRIFAPYVACACFVLSAIGIGILATGVTDYRVYIAAVLIGFSIGAEIDLLAFMTGRYFGLKHFGRIYGLLFASMMIGVSIGPYVYGLCFDITGSYMPVLSLSCLLVISVAIVTGLLPGYPDFQAQSAPS